MTPPINERTQAIEIVNKGFDSLNSLPNVKHLGKLHSFTQDEHIQLEAFYSLVEGYIRQKSPQRPLCLAVFGPPGSGKSHIVRGVCTFLEERHPEMKLPLTVVNLTELQNPEELIRVMRKIRLRSGSDAVPVVFFDEFDAPMCGVPLGWLGRFLAPMQDGELWDEGERFELRRAIYIFAGGTSTTMADFGVGDPSAFREAKGPDFVSRLRGYIDVLGPNHPTATLLRRAVLMRSALEDAEKVRTGNSKAPARKITARLLNAMLDVGRYRHGSRSIKAIIEMAAATADDNASLDLKHLPPDFVLSVHRDLGPLDSDSIGGLIGVSAGSRQGKASASHPGISRLRGWNRLVIDLATALWKLGAVIGYGGKWDENRTTVELIRQLNTTAKDLVDGTSKLTPSSSPPIESRMEVYARERPKTRVPKENGVVAIPVPSYAGNSQEHPLLHRAATSFLMRWTMSCRCVARIVISGKLEGFSGRMPGILEETLLALRLNQPLYVIGGFGGASQTLGELLGLACEWPHQTREMGAFPVKTDSDLDRLIAGTAHVFKPAGFADLPLTYTEAVSYVAGYSIGGPKWPDNGLSVSENRQLFVTRDRKTIVELITRGLSRRFQF